MQMLLARCCVASVPCSVKPGTPTHVRQGLLDTMTPGRQGCGVAKACVTSSKTELFSFGSGSWKEGSEADATMQEVDGRWLHMQLGDANARVILENKSLPDAIAVKTEVPITLKELLLALETSGEVNVAVNSHLVAREGVTFKVSSCAPLAFLLDAKVKKACLPCLLTVFHRNRV